MSSLIINISWTSAMLLLALAFPLQVLFNNPNMALLAYIPIFIIYIASSTRRISRQEWIALDRLKGIDIVVLLYVALILGHIFAALVKSGIPLREGFRQIFLFIIPATFYFYVSRFAREDEFKSIFAGIVAAGLIVGLYFAYDSFTKMILHELGNYQVRAIEYSVARMGLSAEQLNSGRLTAGARSVGLLEVSAVSGVWIGLGGFASLFLLAARSKIVRFAAGLGWLILLIVGLNFTSIFGFLIATIIIYVWPSGGIHSLLKPWRITLRQVVIYVSLALAAAVAMVFCFGHPVLASHSINFFNFIAHMVTLQLSKIFTVRIEGDGSVVAWILLAVKSYGQSVVRHPLALFLGSGPVASDDFRRGGDVGFVETLALLGLPLFCLIVNGLFRTARGVLRELRVEAASPAAVERRGYLEFGLAAILFISIFEAHYSVWAYKSVSPILFVALGLVRRYDGGMKWNS